LVYPTQGDVLQNAFGSEKERLWNQIPEATTLVSPLKPVFIKKHITDGGGPFEMGGRKNWVIH